MRLKDKVVAVTASTRGIGLAAVQACARAGAVVYFAARNPELAENEAQKLRKEGHRAFCVYHDAGKPETYDEMVAQIVKASGRLDVLVNNYGTSDPSRDLDLARTDPGVFLGTVTNNLRSVFLGSQAAARQMAVQGGGSIINISSVVGEYGNIGQANYAASKAGVIGLTKTWAKEFARKGVPVRVNAIAPGYIMTDMMKTVPEDLLKKFAGLTMLGRLGQPEEIAKAALFLASDDASYVTGHVLSVNGGMRL